MMARMEWPAERTERVSAALWVATGLIALAGIVLTIVGWDDLVTADAIPNLVSGFGGLVYSTLGLLIVRRARNAFGWILQGLGLGFAFLSFTGAYAVVGIATSPGALPGPQVVGMIAQTTWVLTAPSLAFMLFFFPTGRLPSARWRPIVGVGVTAVLLTAIGFLVNPVSYGIPAPGGRIRMSNPWGIGSLRSVLSAALVVTVWTVLIAVGAACAAVVVRYRTGDRELRQQIKWVAFVAALAMLCNVVAFLSLTACHCDLSPIANVMFYGVELLVLLGIPTALTVAILKYRLYDLDLIISRAVVYGLLAAAFTAVYLLIVVGVGSLIGYGGGGDPTLTAIAAVTSALSFQPLRRRLRRVANRLVYGDRATPYQVLSDFAERMAGTFGLDDVLQRMASILALGTGATRVDVWLRVGGELRPVATWPSDAAVPEPVPLPGDDVLPGFDVTRAVAVRHGDELLGALALAKPRNEPLSPTEDKLLQDLASQAGLVLRNVRLTAELQATIDELRASRRRLVGAQDDERRKIERNLHDGAQQQLVALTVQLGLLERLAEEPERVRQMASQLQGGLRDALDDLRDLARGIYPPLLADKGLAMALEAQGRKAAVTTTIEPDGVGRYPREVEAAVYFCTLEAMQNVAKYADATSAIVRLAERDGDLVFEIQDDGRGFDTESTTYGTGLQGMADRLDAIGGRLEIRSAPGQGTLVRGEIAVDVATEPVIPGRSP
jgi:signal transduction histidine kinase